MSNIKTAFPSLDRWLGIDQPTAKLPLLQHANMLSFQLLVAGSLALLLQASINGVLASPTKLDALETRQYYPPDDPGKGITKESCIETSLTSPRWGIYSPTLVTVNGSSGGSQGDVQFGVVHHATGVEANCSAHNIELDPKTPEDLAVWHNCSIPGLDFQFELNPNLDMRLRGSWKCDRADDAYAEHQS